MDITFHRGSKQKQQTVESFVRFCSNELMPKMAPRLSVEFHFVTGLHDKEGIFGDTDYYEDGAVPRDFIVRLDAGIDGVELLRTVAHELVHVKQISRNELKELVLSPQYRFCKKYYSKNTTYHNRPWEIEALEKEQILVDNWLQFKG
jgi:hypothetical protein